MLLQATQVDNSDRYALATLSVSRAMARGGGVRFRRRQYSAAVSEAAAPGHTLLTLHTAPPPAHLTHVRCFNITSFRHVMIHESIYCLICFACGFLVFKSQVL